MQIATSERYLKVSLFISIIFYLIQEKKSLWNNEQINEPSAHSCFILMMKMFSCKFFRPITNKYKFS